MHKRLGEVWYIDDPGIPGIVFVSRERGLAQWLHELFESTIQQQRTHRRKGEWGVPWWSKERSSGCGVCHLTIMAAVNNERVHVRVRRVSYLLFLSLIKKKTGSRPIIYGNTATILTTKEREGLVSPDHTHRWAVAGPKCCLSTWLWRSRRRRRLELFYKTNDIQVAWDLSKSIPKCVYPVYCKNNNNIFLSIDKPP